MDREWLDQLETRVKQASETLRSLKERNGELEARVAELEQKVADAESGAVAAWQEERDEIRLRVEGLTGKLERLLES